MMKTVQMTIDEELLNAVDAAVRDLGTSRSAFLRDALQQASAILNLGKGLTKWRRGVITWGYG